jgi:hypothetical protein
MSDQASIHNISLFDEWTSHKAIALLDVANFKGKSAVYSLGIDRFIFVSEFDPWSVLRTAKLLYHKLPLQVFVFTEKSPPIDNSNCFQWTIVNKGTLSNAETPTLKIVDFQKDVVDKGLPNHCPLTLEELRKDQEFAVFILRACHALRLTDAILNNGDYQFYLKFFPDIKKQIQFSYYDDPTHWPGGFVQVIEGVLFHSNSIEEVKLKLEQLLPMDERKAASTLLNYSAIFFKLLGWSPTS